MVLTQRVNEQKLKSNDLSPVEYRIKPKVRNLRNRREERYDVDSAGESKRKSK
jgi:hypothetical protein